MKTFIGSKTLSGGLVVMVYLDLAAPEYWPIHQKRYVRLGRGRRFTSWPNLSDKEVPSVYSSIKDVLAAYNADPVRIPHKLTESKDLAWEKADA